MLLLYSKMADTLDMVQLTSILNMLLGILVPNFFICDLGERVTNQFVMFDEELKQHCVWYLLPLDMQRTYLLCIGHTQNEPTFQCFGNIRCSRETFKKVSQNQSYVHFISFFCIF